MPDDLIAPTVCKLPDELTAKRMTSLLPFVRQSGDSIRPRWSMGERKLLDYLLVAVHTGHGVFTLEDEVFEVNAGDLFWFPPGVRNSMTGDSETMHCIYLHFDLVYDPKRSHWNMVIPGGTLDLAPYRTLLHPACPDPVMAGWRGLLPTGSCYGVIVEIMRHICRLHQRSNGYPWEISGLMLSLLDEIAQSILSAGNPLPDRRLEEAVNYLEKHFTDHELDIKKLAHKVHVSASHLRKLFQARHATTPAGYLRERRCRWAKELLMFTELSVGEIAEAAGFGNIYHFSRTFKHTAGMTPGDFRRQSR